MRKYFKAAYLLIVVILVASCDGADVGRPNILLITTDDMGYTDLGAFGGRDIPTPNLDALALDGLRLSNFQASPSCAPSRAMLMSGLGNHEAGLGALPGIEGEYGSEGFVQDRVALLPEVLRANGYQTLMAGKWHLGYMDDTDATLPGAKGFEKDYSLLASGDSHFESVYESRVEWSENGKRLAKPPADYYSTTIFVDKLIGFLNSIQHSDAPFFAWFAPSAPHMPLHSPPGWENHRRGDYARGYDVLCEERMRGASSIDILEDITALNCFKTTMPWEKLDAGEKALQARTMEVYAAMVEHLDQEIGRLLAVMDENGQLENTWVIYLNDNGPHPGGPYGRPLGEDMDPANYTNTVGNIGQPRSWVSMPRGWADAISAPFREAKGKQYEGGIRVPAFIWKSGGKLQPGGIERQRLTVMDIMPTILDLTGTEPPGSEFQGRKVLPMRGISFAPLLLGQAFTVHAADEIIALDSGGNSVLLRGDFKLVRQRGAEWQLFNLDSDPNELVDVAGQVPELYESLIKEFRYLAEQYNYIFE